MAHGGIVGDGVLMVARNLAGGLPEVIAGYHGAAIPVDVGIACCAVGVVGAAWQLDTGYLPTVAVEQDEHGV